MNEVSNAKNLRQETVFAYKSPFSGNREHESLIIWVFLVPRNNKQMSGNFFYIYTTKTGDNA